MSNTVATKGNLMAIKKSLALAKVGYDLLERKRNVLVREMMLLVDKVKLLRNEISDSYSLAYYYLQQANMSQGLIIDVVSSIHIEDSLKIKYRSVMGVEIPELSLDDEELTMEYSFSKTSSKVDEAFIQFDKVKQLTLILTEVDNSVYRLANAIRKTQKRANALKNIVIPNFEVTIKKITEDLEEKEREEFSRLKVIKNNKKVVRSYD